MSIRERLVKALKSPVQRTYEQQAQITRSLKYRISIKEGGRVTKLDDYPEVPEVLFGDPVNFRFPLSPLERVREAITAFNNEEGKEGYNLSEWEIIGRRIGQAYPGWSYNKRTKLVQPINIQDFVRAREGDKGLHEQAQAIEDAFRKQYGQSSIEMTASPEYDLYVRDVYPDYVIANSGTEFFKVPYSIKDENIIFEEKGTWEKVEQTYVSAREGGPGSGHHGHSGRPGKRGGSAPGKAGGKGKGAAAKKGKEKFGGEYKGGSYDSYKTEEGNIEVAVYASTGEEIAYSEFSDDEEGRYLGQLYAEGKIRKWNKKQTDAVAAQPKGSKGSIRGLGEPPEVEAAFETDDVELQDKWYKDLDENSDLVADVIDRSGRVDAIDSYVSAFEAKGFTVETTEEHDPGYYSEYKISKGKEFVYWGVSEDDVREGSDFAYREADEIFTRFGYDVLKFGDDEILSHVIVPKGTRPSWMKKWDFPTGKKESRKRSSKSKRSLRRRLRAGGPGSGHHGHAGRPGKRGGSAPGKAGGKGKAPAYADPSDFATKYREEEADRIYRDFEEEGLLDDRAEYDLEDLSSAGYADPETTAMLYLKIQTEYGNKEQAEKDIEEWYPGAKEKQWAGVEKFLKTAGKFKSASSEFKKLDKSGGLENMAQHDLQGLFDVYSNTSEDEVRKLYHMLQRATGKQ